MVHECIMLLCMGMFHTNWAMVQYRVREDRLSERERAMLLQVDPEKWLVVVSHLGQVLAIVNKEQFPADAHLEAHRIQMAYENRLDQQQRKKEARDRVMEAAQTMSPCCFVFCGPDDDEAWSDDDEQPTARRARCCVSGVMSINA